MKKFVREYLKFVIPVILLNVIVISSLFIKVKYDVVAPANITNVASTITIEKGSYCDVNTVSVYSYSNVNLLSYLIGKINKNATISKTYEYEVTDLDLVYTSGVIQKRVSIYNSIISAYKLAGYDNIIDNNSYKGYIIHTLATYADPNLRVGDIVTNFNNIKLVGLTGINELQNTLDKIIFEKDKEYPITVLRQVKTSDGYVEKEFNFNIKTNYFYNYDEQKIAAFGIYSYEYVIPVKNDLIPQFQWNYGDSIGPSGGLMQSLYIYEALTGGHLTNNLKIVGTGTVDVYGNAGPIGGIYQKVITANLCGADIFFVPVSSLDENVYKNESNYIEAVESYNNLNNTKMKLVIVSSLNDIIEYLKNK